MKTPIRIDATLIAALFTAVAVLISAATTASAAGKVEIDRVRIAVDDLVLTEREVKSMLSFESQELSSQFKGEELAEKLAELEKHLLDRMVEDLLVENRATRLGIQVNEKEINARVDSIIARDPKVTDSYSEEELKNFIVKDLLKRQVMAREINAYIHVGQREIHSACLAETGNNREVHVGHILFQGDDEAALKKATDALALLKLGSDFADLAMEISEDSSAASNHGDLGFISRGQFVKEFEERAFSMEVGAVSQPVKTKFGFHIIKLFEERSKAGIDCDSLDEVNRARLMDDLYRTLRDVRVKEFMAKLRETAVIRIFDSP